MKVPRSVNAKDLIKVLEQYGYILVRQGGSHIRMSKTIIDKKHSVTIPNHNPMKIGTFQKIAKEVCVFNKLSVKEFYSKL